MPQTRDWRSTGSSILIGGLSGGTMGLRQASPSGAYAAATNAYLAPLLQDANKIAQQYGGGGSYSASNFASAPMNVDVGSALPNALYGDVIEQARLNALAQTEALSSARQQREQLLQSYAAQEQHLTAFLEGRRAAEQMAIQERQAQALQETKRSLTQRGLTNAQAEEAIATGLRTAYEQAQAAVADRQLRERLQYDAALRGATLQQYTGAQGQQAASLAAQSAMQQGPAGVMAELANVQQAEREGLGKARLSMKEALQSQLEQQARSKEKIRQSMLGYAMGIQQLAAEMPVKYQGLSQEFMNDLAQARATKLNKAVGAIPNVRLTGQGMPGNTPTMGQQLGMSFGSWASGMGYK